MKQEMSTDDFLSCVKSYLDDDFEEPECSQALEMFETIPESEYNRVLALLYFTLENEVSSLTLDVIEEMLSDKTLIFLDGIMSEYDYGIYLFGELYDSKDIRGLIKYINFDEFGMDYLPEVVSFTDNGMVYRED